MEAARPERPEEQSPGGLDERTGFSGPYYKLSLVIFSVIDRLVEIAIDREQLQIDRLMESEKKIYLQSICRSSIFSHNQL